MPTLTIPHQSQYLPFRPLSWDISARAPLHGSDGQELARLEEKLLEYWKRSCEQIHVLREAHETTNHQAMPPNRTFTIPIRYHLRGRGEPLSYQIGDE